MSRAALFLGATMLFAAPAAATGLQSQFYPENTTAAPGETTAIGQVELTADSTSASNIQSSVNFPFNTSLNPSTIQDLSEGESVNISVNATPKSTTQAQTYTRTLTAESNEYAADTEISIQVPEVTTWNLTGVNTTENVSVGSTGNFGALSITGTGNQDVVLEVATEGNLTGFIDTRSTVSVFPGVDTSVPVNYAVPRDAAFGFYNASVSLSGGGVNETVDLSARFLDEIRPEVESAEVPDVQATQSEDFRVKASDNLEVSSVTGEILREVRVQRNNETVRVNQTFAEVDFTRRTPNAEEWNYTFTDSDQEGQYHINITASDESGNVDRAFRSFTVDRLNGTQVLAENFEFEAVEPDQQAGQPIFENLLETPVNVSLEQISHDSQNSSFQVGLRKQGDEVATRFQGQGDSITVESEGVAELVVESDSVEDFNGRLSLEPVPQAKQLPDIVFSGEFIDPVYPTPQNYSIGRFSGTVEYADEGEAEKQRIVMTLEGSAGQCQGFDRFGECINGFSLGEIPQIEKRVDKSRRERNLGVGFGLLSFVGLGFYLLKERRAGLHTLVERVEIE